MDLEGSLPSGICGWGNIRDPWTRKHQGSVGWRTSEIHSWGNLRDPWSLLHRASAPNVQLLTPVRRSLRIEHTMASYPNMLRDHDLVVSSLAEIAGGHIVICKNEALPEDVELEILGLGQ